MSVIDWPSAIVWFAFPEVIDPETAQFEATTIIDPEMVVEAVAAQAGAEAVAISELSTFIV